MSFESKRLDEVAEIVGGGTPSTKVAENWDGDIPWLTPKDLSTFEGIYVKRGSRSLTEKGFSSSSARMLPAGSVLYTSRAPIGYVAIAKNSISTNQGFKSLILKDGYVPEFVFYLLKASKAEIESHASGGTFAEISARALGEVVLNFPSKDIQEAISKILLKLDEKIEINNALSKTLESIAQSIFKSWFIDFDPVHAKSRGEKPFGMDDETAALFPDSFEESDLGMIPKGWNVAQFGDLGKIVTGKTPSTKNPDYWGEDIPFVTIPDITKNRYTLSAERYLSTVGANSQKNQYLPAGTTSVSCIATPGLISFAFVNCQTNQQINSIIPSNEMHPTWLFFRIDSEIHQIKNRSGIGTVFSNLNKSDFSSLTTLLPNLELREKYGEVATPFLEAIKSCILSNMQLIALRDSLLPRLISGELQVPEELLVS